MNPNPHQAPQPRQGVVMSSIGILSTVGSFIIGFFLTPFLHAATIDWFLGFSARHYGAGMDEIVIIVWWGVAFVVIALIARATVGAGLVYSCMALANRFT